VYKYDAYTRGRKASSRLRSLEVLVTILQRDGTLAGIFGQLDQLRKANVGNEEFKVWVLNRITISLEAMIAGGWVTASYNPKFNLASRKADNQSLHWHVDTSKAEEEAGRVGILLRTASAFSGRGACQSILHRHPPVLGEVGCQACQLNECFAVAGVSLS